jgi:spore coat protein U-like protein
MKVFPMRNRASIWNFVSAFLGGLCLASLFVSEPANATTVTGAFNVTITITSQCSVTNATAMAFPSSGLLSAAVNQTSTFSVTCTNTTPYTIGLDNGLNVSGSQRRMKGGASNTEFVNYNLFSDSAHSVAWGNSSGALVNGTGTGTAVGYTVYGQVPAQTTPSAAANYIDTVTINVTY